MRQNDSLKSYNRQLGELVANQQMAIQRKQDEIKRAKNFERDVLPLLERMIAGLERWVNTDIPFQLEERKRIVANLTVMMKQTNVPASEKFRRVLLAYQNEGDYGKTIDGFRGEIEYDGKQRTVNFLRIGRNIWLYQSLDNDQHAIWNSKTQQWQNISNSWRQEISHALRVANKQSAPDLLILPILP